MFAIYNSEGRQFRNTLENLRNVPAIQAGKNPLHKNISADETIFDSELTSRGQNELQVSRKAQQAYREIRQLKHHEPVYHAYQVMTHPVRTISMNISILDAQRKCQQYGFRQMPVISPQQQIVGMLSITDVMQFVIIDGEEIHYIPGKKVSDAMSKDVITADPVTDIRRVAEVMQEYHLSAIPIVNEDDALVGIVSRGDILRAIINNPPLHLWS